MKTEKLQLNITLPVSPENLYKDWLDSKQHSKFTGGKAKIQAKINSRYSAWDGYITGKILELDPGKRILHTWRTSEFAKGAEDSILEITFSKKGKGTQLTLNHSNLQPGDGKKYKQGWKEFYLEPMKKHFKK